MPTTKITHFSTAHKTLALTIMLIVIALLLSAFNSTFNNGKDARSAVKNSPSMGEQAERPQGGVDNTAYVWTPLNFSFNANKNTEVPKENDKPTKTPTDQAQNAPTSPTPTQAKPTKTKLASVTAAENQTYTSGNRLFVTGENGIFEIVPKPNGEVAVIQRAPKQKCAFGGIVETLGVLYVNCSGYGKAYVYAATVTAEPSFNRIYTYKSAFLPNGLTADTSGHLYVASSFLGQILRLTPSTANPLTFSNTGLWRNGTGPATNGIKFADNSIYWTDSPYINRIAIKSDGKPGKQTRILSALTFFDDLSVDKDGILVADYTGRKIRSYTLNGKSNGTIPMKFSGPSSVARARAPFPAGSLIVTERDSNQVSLFIP